ncbi:MAG: hypothetical protein AB8F95_07955 [Bacteroidia bacterium]
MQFQISIDPHFPHLLNIHLRLYRPDPNTELKLPRWRPGRYSYADYAKDIADIHVCDPSGDTVSITRIETNAWHVACKKNTDYLDISYRFFPNKADAGGSWFDDELFLLNPINCFLYTEQHKDQVHSVQLPTAYQYYTQLTEESHGYFEATDFQQLLDSPVIGHSDTAEVIVTSLTDIPVSVDFVEIKRKGAPSVQSEIEALAPVIKAQVALFDGCPVDHYDFLFFPSPNRMRHGVEHVASSLLVMGPSSTFTEADTISSLLELSSHEFFHVWNVKNIRPQAMLPYQFDHLPPTPLHYVTEGVTTYYGDLMIWKAGVWEMDRWLKSINNELLRFFGKPARLHTSLRQASLDSAINGYQEKGVPDRRISFYNKGYLVAMLLDFAIRQSSDHAYSLDHVMRSMYRTFGVPQIGYTEADFWKLVERFSGKSSDTFKAAFVDGLEDLCPALESMGTAVGLELTMLPYHDPLTRELGLVTEAHLRGQKLTYLYQESPLLQFGLRYGDVITHINDIATQLVDWKGAVNDQGLIKHIKYLRNGEEFHLDVGARSLINMSLPQFAVLLSPDQKQLAARQSWKAIPKAVEVLSK